MTVALNSRDVDPYLANLTERGWWHYYFPNRENPTAIASVFTYSTCVDVIQVFSEHDAFAYRAEIPTSGNVFAPDVVWWTYGGDPVWTYRNAMTLPDPDDPTWPRVKLPAPPMCRVLANIAANTGRYVVRPNLPAPRQSASST